MHQWIKAILCQEVKQMTPTHLRDKDVSGKCRKPCLKLSKTCQFQYLILIQSRQHSGHRRDKSSQPARQGIHHSQTGRVHTPTHKKSQEWLCVQQAPRQVREGSNVPAERVPGHSLPTTPTAACLHGRSAVKASHVPRGRSELLSESGDLMSLRLTSDTLIMGSTQGRPDSVFCVQRRTERLCNGTASPLSTKSAARYFL